MSIPEDTSPEAWQAQGAALSRLGSEGRVKMAAELSEAVREIQIAGLLDRNPHWSRREAVRRLVFMNLGVELPPGR